MIFSWNELQHDKTKKNECVPSEDSDQPGHLPSLIRVFAVRMKKAWVLSYLLSTQRRLICLYWGLTSQSTIFQSCRNVAIASWVINQYFRGVKCLAQGHNMVAVGLEPPTSRSGVRHSTTEPPRSPKTLIRLGAQVILLVLSCRSSNLNWGTTIP